MDRGWDAPGLVIHPVILALRWAVRRSTRAAQWSASVVGNDSWCEQRARQSGGSMAYWAGIDLEQDIDREGEGVGR